eukprot:4521203-Amphidinium_carterae.1
MHAWCPTASVCPTGMGQLLLRWPLQNALEAEDSEEKVGDFFEAEVIETPAAQLLKFVCHKFNA